MNKVINDIHCSLDIALFWALNAKVFKTAVFSSFQLVLGRLTYF